MKLRRRRLRAEGGEAHKDDMTPSRKCSHTIFGLTEVATKTASFIQNIASLLNTDGVRKPTGYIQYSEH